MSVTWVTRDTRAPMVQWWESSNNSQNESPVIVAAGGRTSTQRFKKRSSSKKEEIKQSEAPASSTTYSQHDMCTPPATTIGFHDPGQIHTAVIKGLQGGALYTYRVGDKGSSKPSPTRPPTHPFTCLNPHCCNERPPLLLLLHLQSRGQRQ